MVKSFESDENKRNERRKTLLEDTHRPQDQRWVNLSGQCDSQGHSFLRSRRKFVYSIPRKIALEGLNPKFARASSEFSYSSTFQVSKEYFYNENCG